MKKRTKSRLMLLLRSVWHWDLWAASVVSVGIGVLLALTDPVRRWELFIPIVILIAVVSINIAWRVWNQWESLRSRLSGSYYGELLRLTDKSESEARLPYLVTLCVAIASFISALLTAVFIVSLNDTLVTLSVILTSWLAAWMFFAVVSIFMLSAEHDKMMAEVESMREETAAAQRLHERELRQREAANSRRPEQKAS